mmetsp:Transcript_44614/g.94866  ORF Transcript_44614/g.94866 Transcript_44614/m.94866 type:complete len:91 (-) Transcript_44614:423-695(-)
MLRCVKPTVSQFVGRGETEDVAQLFERVTVEAVWVLVSIVWAVACLAGVGLVGRRELSRALLLSMIVSVSGHKTCDRVNEQREEMVELFG